MTLFENILRQSQSLKETTADLFYDKPEFYEVCMQAGLDYMQDNPYVHKKTPYDTKPSENWWNQALLASKENIRPFVKSHRINKDIHFVAMVLGDEAESNYKNMIRYKRTGSLPSAY